MYKIVVHMWPRGWSLIHNRSVTPLTLRQAQRIHTAYKSKDPHYHVSFTYFCSASVHKCCPFCTHSSLSVIVKAWAQKVEINRVRILYPAAGKRWKVNA